MAGVQLTGGSITGTTGVLTSTSNFDLQSGTVSAGLGGSFGISKTTAGTVNLAGTTANTFTGTTTVSEGNLNLGKTGANAIGGNLTVSGGTATLTGTGSDQIADTASVAVSSGTFAIGANNETVAGVQLTGGSITGTGGVLTSTSNFDLQSGTASAALGGSAGVDKSGPGTVTLSGANTYTGATTISGGTLAISSEQNLGANPGALNAGQLTLNGGTLATTASFSIDDANRGVTIGANGGTIDTAASTTLTVASGNSVTFSGTFTKAGGGTLDIQSAGTGTGNTIVNSGTLLANNSTGSATGSGTVTVNGGSLGGTGTIGGATTVGNATLTGGTDGTIGTLTFGSTLDVASNTTWLVDLAGGASPTSDRINVAGILTLNDALLQINDSNWTYNNRFIVAEYGSLGGTGMFTWNNSALAQGATFATSLGQYQINYEDDGFGGFGGHQITITAVPEPSQVIAIVLLLVAGLWFGRRRLNLVKPQELES